MTGTLIKQSITNHSDAQTAASAPFYTISNFADTSSSGTRLGATGTLSTNHCSAHEASSNAFAVAK
jgi:hypothetical protein